MDVPIGDIATCDGDRVPFTLSKQSACCFPPIQTKPTPPDMGSLVYLPPSLEPYSGQVDFSATHQAHWTHIPQPDISPSVSCTFTASPQCESISTDYTHLVDEPGNGFPLYYTYFCFGMGSKYHTNTSEDNVARDIGILNSQFSTCNHYTGETLQSTTTDELFGQSSFMDNAPPTISYPAASELPETPILISGNDGFDASYQPYTSFVSGIQQQPLDFRQQEFRAVGSPAITQAARKRRARQAVYQCGLCNSTFTARHNLKNHIDAHTGLKRHTCHKCGRGFVQKHVLTRHKKTLCK
ncbi:hypothetical protein E1B28_010956 [Marasmius oreades]|uniref:C2H2-type domain-containing protein n=1 Tax=Marasmius oreades TaxID=181124 RepID=A0A9P7RTR0_9AGAR|nr:uncharacterized protein E1B28_010956 [Marasmius oreades]KAG7089258.1 hypothetical protein E1B28_010956 [Marasmius oreades]